MKGGAGSFWRSDRLDRDTKGLNEDKKSCLEFGVQSLDDMSKVFSVECFGFVEYMT
jgi:hypothetical protein